MNCDFCGEEIQIAHIWFKTKDKACGECNEWLEEQDDQRNDKPLNCDWEYEKWREKYN